jgi:hypothetical protein
MSSSYNTVGRELCVTAAHVRFGSLAAEAALMPVSALLLKADVAWRDFQVRQGLLRDIGTTPRGHKLFKLMATEIA